MVDPHPLDFLVVVVAAPLTALQGQAGELLFELGDNGAQTIDIGLQNVPFEEQERQICSLRSTIGFISTPTHSPGRILFAEKLSLIQGRGGRRSRFPAGVRFGQARRRV